MNVQVLSAIYPVLEVGDELYRKVLVPAKEAEDGETATEILVLNHDAFCAVWYNSVDTAWTLLAIGDRFECIEFGVKIPMCFRVGIPVDTASTFIGSGGEERDLEIHYGGRVSCIPRVTEIEAVTLDPRALGERPLGPRVGVPFTLTLSGRLNREK